LLVSGRFSGEALAAVDEHLDGCRACRLLVSGFAAQTGEPSRKRDPLSAFAKDDVVAGRYRIVALIGAGGMGEVYEAMDSVLGEMVALKTLTVASALDAAGIARIKAELQIARRVTHRNVCRVFDVGFHRAGLGASADSAGSPFAEGIPFFTMELLRGETLRARLQRTGPLPPAQAVLVLTQMVAAIDSAHAAGVVHTDLKSENVMLVEEDGSLRVVITDFGLATRFDARDVAKPDGDPFLAGTIGYMAPERLAGAPPGPATDIYALGVVLFEVLSARLPYDVPSIIQSQAAGRALARPAPPSLSSVGCAAPAGWDLVIERCLRLAPLERFSRASEVLDVLQRRTVQAPRARRNRVTLLFACAGVFAVAISAVKMVDTATRSHAHDPAVASFAPARTADENQAAPRVGHPSTMTPTPTAADRDRLPRTQVQRRPPRVRRGNRQVPASAARAPGPPAVQHPPYPPPLEDPAKDDVIDPFVLPASPPRDGTR
jgi:serine/threonine protein kinase